MIAKKKSGASTVGQQPQRRLDRVSRIGTPAGRPAGTARWRLARTREQKKVVNAGTRAAMRAANPAFIPRNHLVEEAISAAVNDGNFLPFEGLLTVLSMPYEDQPAFGRYVDPPRPDQVVHQTFCGT